MVLAVCGLECCQHEAAAMPCGDCVKAPECTGSAQAVCSTLWGAARWFCAHCTALLQQSRRRPALLQQARRRPALLQQARRRPALLQQARRRPALLQQARRRPAHSAAATCQLQLAMRSAAARTMPPRSANVCNPRDAMPQSDSSCSSDAPTTKRHTSTSTSTDFCLQRAGRWCEADALS